MAPDAPPLGDLDPLTPPLEALLGPVVRLLYDPEGQRVRA